HAQADRAASFAETARRSTPAGVLADPVRAHRSGALARRRAKTLVVEVLADIIEAVAEGPVTGAVRLARDRLTGTVPPDAGVPAGAAVRVVAGARDVV